MDGLLWEIGREKHNHHVLGPSSERQEFKKVQEHCFWSRGIRTFLAWFPRCMWQLDIAPAMDRWRLPKCLGWHLSPCTRSVLILHLKAFFQLQSNREKTSSAHTLTNSLIPIPLPQHQHTFLSETTFRPGLPWSSSGRNEQNEIRFILFISTWRRPGQSWSKRRLWQKSVLVLRERHWYYHDNAARENLFTNSLFVQGGNSVQWNLLHLEYYLLLCMWKN